MPSACYERTRTALAGLGRLTADRGPVEALPLPAPESPAEGPETAGADRARDADLTPRSGLALTGEARDRLTAVLKDLLECKRMLERAREG